MSNANAVSRMSKVIRALPYIGFKNHDPNFPFHGKWRANKVTFLNPSKFTPEGDVEEAVKLFVGKINRSYSNCKYFVSINYSETKDGVISIHRIVDEDMITIEPVNNRYGGHILMLTEYSTDYLGTVTEENMHTYIDKYNIDSFNDDCIFRGPKIYFENGRFKMTALWEIPIDDDDDDDDDDCLENTIARIKGSFSMTSLFVID